MVARRKTLRTYRGVSSRYIRCHLCPPCGRLSRGHGKQDVRESPFIHSFIHSLPAACPLGPLDDPRMSPLRTRRDQSPAPPGQVNTAHAGSVPQGTWRCPAPPRGPRGRGEPRPAGTAARGAPTAGLRASLPAGGAASRGHSAEPTSVVTKPSWPGRGGCGAGRLRGQEAAAAAAGLPAAQSPGREALRAGKGTQEHAYGREGLLPRAQTEQAAEHFPQPTELGVWKRSTARAAVKGACALVILSLKQTSGGKERC